MPTLAQHSNNPLRGSAVGHYPRGPSGPYVASSWAATRLGKRVFASKAEYRQYVRADFDPAGRHHPTAVAARIAVRAAQEAEREARVALENAPRLRQAVWDGVHPEVSTLVQPRVQIRKRQARVCLTNGTGQGIRRCMRTMEEEQALIADIMACMYRPEPEADSVKVDASESITDIPAVKVEVPDSSLALSFDEADTFAVDGPAMDTCTTDLPSAQDAPMTIKLESSSSVVMRQEPEDETLPVEAFDFIHVPMHGVVDDITLCMQALEALKITPEEDVHLLLQFSRLSVADDIEMAKPAPKSEPSVKSEPMLIEPFIKSESVDHIMTVAPLEPIVRVESMEVDQRRLEVTSSTMSIYPSDISPARSGCVDIAVDIDMAASRSIHEKVSMLVDIVVSSSGVDIKLEDDEVVSFPEAPVKVEDVPMTVSDVPAPVKLEVPEVLMSDLDVSAAMVATLPSRSTTLAVDVPMKTEEEELPITPSLDSLVHAMQGLAVAETEDVSIYVDENSFEADFEERPFGPESDSVLSFYTARETFSDDLHLLAFEDAEDLADPVESPSILAVLEEFSSPTAVVDRDAEEDLWVPSTSPSALPTLATSDHLAVDVMASPEFASNFAQAQFPELVCHSFVECINEEAQTEASAQREVSSDLPMGSSTSAQSLWCLTPFATAPDFFDEEAFDDHPETDVSSDNDTSSEPQTPREPFAELWQIAKSRVETEGIVEHERPEPIVAEELEQVQGEPFEALWDYARACPPTERVSEPRTQPSSCGEQADVDTGRALADVDPFQSLYEEIDDLLELFAPSESMSGLPPTFSVEELPPSLSISYVDEEYYRTPATIDLTGAGPHPNERLGKAAREAFWQMWTRPSGEDLAKLFECRDGAPSGLHIFVEEDKSVRPPPSSKALSLTVQPLRVEQSVGLRERLRHEHRDTFLAHWKQSLEQAER